MIHAENITSSHIYLLNTIFCVFAQAKPNTKKILKKRQNTFRNEMKTKERMENKQKHTNTSWYSSVCVCVFLRKLVRIFILLFTCCLVSACWWVCVYARTHLFSPMEYFLMLIVCCYCWCYLLLQMLVLTTKTYSIYQWWFSDKKKLYDGAQCTKNIHIHIHIHIHGSKIVNGGQNKM